MPKVSFLSGEVGNTSLDLLPSHARIVRFLGPGCFLVTHSSICHSAATNPHPWSCGESLDSSNLS